MSEHIQKTVFVSPDKERQYLMVPFTVGENIERIDIAYRYPRFDASEESGFSIARNGCTIDLAIGAPNGELIGASGSDRERVYVSPLGSSPGFKTREIEKGEWNIILGAYHVPEGGVTVVYHIELTHKERRLFKGDTHAHTVASDGCFTVQELADAAVAQKLDFLFVTDHNNTAQNRNLPERSDITVMPGTEWTHYKGHANFLGVMEPYVGRYYSENLIEAVSLMAQAQVSGALVTLNHPFCPLVPWEWGFDVPYDAVEVWNGIMSERNERAVIWWHAKLLKGERIAITGGSDFHRPGLFASLGLPCHCMYAPSRSKADILAAIKKGRGYISYLPEGPGVDIRAEVKDGGFASFGDAVPSGSEVEIRFFDLRVGDEIRIITDAETQTHRCPQGAMQFTTRARFLAAKFLRAEVFRSYAPGLPPMRAALTNALYFEG
ncbi:MAG TPA: CehA/McbA family metallohydrolase [Clostridia bacterium]|nr:CehA/McbA family metallohydrolase [Clostridia bacterium]